MTTIDHTCIHVLDLDRSAAFYRDALGLTPVRSLDMPDRGWQGNEPHRAVSPRRRHPPPRPPRPGL